MRARGPLRAEALILDPLRRHRGLALALLLTAAVLALRQARERVDYTHTQLPNFDSYVYAAMADKTPPWL